MPKNGPRESVCRVSPWELVDAARTDLTSFLSLYGDTQLLLVRIPEGDPELAVGLQATGIRGASGKGVKPPAEPMQFHTALQPAEVFDDAAFVDEPTAIGRLLVESHHFGLPLRKREGADALFMDRISVGRARNKDIVLRHVSVSKFHGWFELDEVGGFVVVDAESKNQTRINGKPLQARERHPVKPGDTIRFGSVEAALSSPQAFWSALQTVDVISL